MERVPEVKNRNMNEATTERADDYMLLCPICKTTFGDYFNVGRDHFAYCEEHKLCWNFGSNQNSFLEGQTKEQWEAIANKFILEGYQIVRGFHWPTVNGAKDLQDWLDQTKKAPYRIVDEGFNNRVSNATH